MIHASLSIRSRNLASACCVVPAHQENHPADSRTSPLQYLRASITGLRPCLFNGPLFTEEPGKRHKLDPGTVEAARSPHRSRLLNTDRFNITSGQQEAIVDKEGDLDRAEIDVCGVGIQPLHQQEEVVIEHFEFLANEVLFVHLRLPANVD